MRCDIFSYKRAHRKEVCWSEIVSGFFSSLPPYCFKGILSHIYPTGGQIPLFVVRMLWSEVFFDHKELPIPFNKGCNNGKNLREDSFVGSAHTAMLTPVLSYREASHECSDARRRTHGQYGDYPQ